jgi:hypothetical protein
MTAMPGNPQKPYFLGLSAFSSLSRSARICLWPPWEASKKLPQAMREENIQMKMKLTKDSVAKLVLPEGKADVLFQDTELKGFAVRLRLDANGKLIKTWAAQCKYDGSTWVLPAERSKNGKSFALPLLPMALGHPRYRPHGLTRLLVRRARHRFLRLGQEQSGARSALPRHRLDRA